MNSSPANNSAELSLKGFDGLRALACLAVFTVHFQQISGVTGTIGPLDVRRACENGNTGVALLFMLSAFHLSLPLWSGQMAAGFGKWFAHYLRSRASRILPAYYLCLTVLVLHQGSLAAPADRHNAVLHYLLVHNYSEPYFYSINNPFWTIAVQAQFYVLLPALLLALLLVGSTRGRIAVAIALLLAAYATHWVVMQQGDAWGESFGWGPMVTDHPIVFSHSVLAHLPVFLLGIIAAGLVWQRHSAASQGVSRAWADAAIPLAAAAVAAILTTALDERLQTPHGRYNWPYVPLLLAIIVAALPASGLWQRTLEFWPLRQLGIISYGVYLFHLPCQRLVEKGLERAGRSAHSDWHLFALASLTLTIVLAAVSFHLFERPLWQWLAGRRLPGLVSGRFAMKAPT